MNDLKKLWLVSHGFPCGPCDDPRMESIAEVWRSHGNPEAGTMEWLAQLRAFQAACGPGDLIHQINNAAVAEQDDRDAEAKVYFVETMAEIQRIDVEAIRTVRMKQLSQQIQDYHTGK